MISNLNIDKLECSLVHEQKRHYIVFNVLEEKKSLKYFTGKRKTEKKVMPNGEMKHGQ